MLKTIAFILAAIVAAVLLYAASKPDTFHVQRSISIKAPPEKIFVLIEDFHSWHEWTPYNKDPAMKHSYTGSESGKGASYAWQGNHEVGSGAMMISDTVPYRHITLELHLIAPFEARNVVHFNLRALGDETEVTWDMDGASPLMAKLVDVFMDMDKAIGKDFELGLAQLKVLAEK